MKPYYVSIILLVAAGQPLFGQQPPEPPAPSQVLTFDQLGDLVAPIALYPDPLLGQILVASTYPLEMVQASQWLARNPGLTGPELTQAAQQQNWDPSVQALAVFPDLVKRLTQDITWTTDLGNAFLNQQADVMDAVQRMRVSAQEAGKLSSTSQQSVMTENDSGRPIIVIEPANPQVVYLPYYDPISIWGRPRYYPYASWFYPPFVGGGYFGFGIGINIGAYFGGGWGGWGGWGWRPGWGNRTIIVNHNFIHRYNFNANRGAILNGRSPWFHDPSHRQAVPYSTPALSSRYGGDARRNPQTHMPAPRPGLGPRLTPPGRSERVGNRRIAPNGPRGRPNVFGGVPEGAAARVQSDHGHSSLGPRRGGAIGRTVPGPRQGGPRGNSGGGKKR